MQETVVSKSSTIFCGKHQVAFDAFCATYGIDTIPNPKDFLVDELRVLDVGRSLENMNRLYDPRSEPRMSWYSIMKISMLDDHRLCVQIGSMGPVSFAKISLKLNGQEATHLRDLVFSLVGSVTCYADNAEELSWAKEVVDHSLTSRSLSAASN